MLERSGDKYFGAKDKESLVKIQRNLRTVAMTLISFYQVDHTYDRAFITKYVEDLKNDLKDLVRPHLTEKSLGRWRCNELNIFVFYPLITYLITELSTSWASLVMRNFSTPSTFPRRTRKWPSKWGSSSTPWTNAWKRAYCEWWIRRQSASENLPLNIKLIHKFSICDTHINSPNEWTYF